MCESFRRRRDLIVRLMRDIPGVEVNEPQGAFYLFPNFEVFIGKNNGGRAIADATDLAMYLLETGHVATVGGDAFGAPGCLRLSYATSEANITEAARRIKAALALLTA